MKTIKLEYNIRDKVYIKDLKIFGVVVSIFIGNKDVEYNVRYFDGVSKKECYFYPFELSTESTKEELGFKK